MKYNLSGIILAGGESRRFGRRPKTEIVIGGRKIIFRILDVIRDIFDEIIIVTNSPERYSEIEECRIVKDIYTGAGPLGGIHAAMGASENEASFVFAGDMPFLNKDLIIKQIKEFRNSNYSAFIPVVNSLAEPLHAIYSNTLISDIEEILKKPIASSIINLLENNNTGYFKLPSSPEIMKIFTNINFASDIKKAEEYLKYISAEKSSGEG